jgi:four helix bundle protein
LPLPTVESVASRRVESRPSGGVESCAPRSVESLASLVVSDLGFASLRSAFRPRFTRRFGLVRLASLGVSDLVGLSIMQRYTELTVWQRTHALTLAVYKITARFPDHERFGLTAQLRRAVSSAPSNIAEGSKRKSNREYAHFLNIAEGSLAETEYLLVHLAVDLGYVRAEEVKPLAIDIIEAARMLDGLRKKVEKAR